MGYRRARKTFRLSFADEPDLEVYAYGTSLGTVLGLLDLVKADGDKFDLTDMRRIGELFETFAECLKSWNLEDEDGTPISLEPTRMKVCGPNGETELETATEAKVRALETQDLDFCLELIMAWMEAVVSVSGPLKRKSSGGDQSPEVLIPMDVK